MEGLYLYCIREKTENPPVISTKGIDGKEEAYTLLMDDLEAIVSKVSLEEFASEEIQRKAQEDLGWIKEKALIHERVVEEAMRKNNHILDLIPMRFGTIFKDERRLKETLNKDYPKIREILERIRRKQEWSIKVYLRDRKNFEQMIKEKNETIKEKEKELASLTEGMAFFIEEELKETISKEVGKELNYVTEGVFESLKKQAVASIKSKILGKELTGRQEPMVLNAAYLIPENNIEDFKKEVMGLNQQMQAKGFFLEYSGPWPSYNFTSLDHFSSLTG
jgi:curved DNA-binding protein CbpA